MTTLFIRKSLLFYFCPGAKFPFNDSHHFHEGESCCDSSDGRSFSEPFATDGGHPSLLLYTLGELGQPLLIICWDTQDCGFYGLGGRLVFAGEFRSCVIVYLSIVSKKVFHSKSDICPVKVELIKVQRLFGETRRPEFLDPLTFYHPLNGTKVQTPHPLPTLLSHNKRNNEDNFTQTRPS